MNLKLLIDGIVRQTTVLIAQLSTASGARSPLPHVADRVFLFQEEIYDLLRRTRLEAQALWERVAAYNESRPPAAETTVKVVFYVGQTLEQSEDDERPKEPLRL